MLPGLSFKVTAYLGCLPHVVPALFHSTDITVNYRVNGLLGTIFYTSVMVTLFFKVLTYVGDVAMAHRWDQGVFVCSLEAGTQCTCLCNPSFQLF